MIDTVLHLHTPLDPLHNDGYQFWSGIGSGSPILVGVAVYVRRHNCHVKRCPFISWHPQGTPGSHPVCRLQHDKHHGPLSRLFHKLGWNHGGSA